MKNFIILVLLSASFVSAEELIKVPAEYKIERGDTIGHILEKFNLSPLWGPHGYVAKTIELNPDGVNEKGNFILPKNSILIPFYSGSTRTPAQETTEAKETETTTEPVNQEQTKAHEEQEKDFFIKFSGAFQFAQIQSIEKADSSEATIESQISPNINIASEYEWSENQKTIIGFGISEFRFNPATGKTINPLRKTYSSLFFNHELSLGSFSIMATLKRQQVPYLRAITTTDLKIENPWINYYGVGLKKKFQLKKSSSFNLEAHYLMNESKKMSDFNIHSGKTLQFVATIKKKTKKTTYESSLFYEKQDQDSSITEQQFINNGIRFGITYDLGDLND